MPDTAECEVEGCLYVVQLGRGDGAKLVSGLALGLELVLLGRKDVFADAVVVEQLDQLLLLGLDLLDGAVVALGFVLDDAGALGQLAA
jgi:hypothetical protein